MCNSVLNYANCSFIFGDSLSYGHCLHHELHELCALFRIRFLEHGDHHLVILSLWLQNILDVGHKGGEKDSKAVDSGSDCLAACLNFIEILLSMQDTHLALLPGLQVQDAILVRVSFASVASVTAVSAVSAVAAIATIAAVATIAIVAAITIVAAIAIVATIAIVAAIAIVSTIAIVSMAVAAITTVAITTVAIAAVAITTIVAVAAIATVAIAIAIAVSTATVCM